MQNLRKGIALTFSLLIFSGLADFSALSSEHALDDSSGSETYTFSHVDRSPAILAPATEQPSGDNAHLYSFLVESESPSEAE